MSQFCPELRGHAHRVCRLYKEAMRNIESYYVYRTPIRYHQVQLRARFDMNMNECDPKKIRQLVFLGENELFKIKNPLPIAKFPHSQPGIAGGVAWERTVVCPDWVMDYWHPLEKAMYPVYFKRREQRKCEFIRKWYCGELV